MADEQGAGAPKRQQVVRVPGVRRARLTAVEGTTSEPHVKDPLPSAPDGAPGPNDERMRREVPPHY